MIYFESVGRHKHNFIIKVDKENTAEIREGKWLQLDDGHGHSIGCVVTENNGGAYITVGTNNSVKPFIIEEEVAQE